jgi:phosphoribosylglycinamide formyltransferase 2
MSLVNRVPFTREEPILGTPLSPHATRVMLLGSGELGKEVIIALQRLGVEVIAVDRYAHAPGHAVAHRSHVIDMNDAQALRELIEREAPDCIVPETVVPTARATWMTMNREHIRKLAAETLGLATSNYRFAGSL